jgi:pyruvate-ferredoxin/flavodoxin oxidoreductase
MSPRCNPRAARIGAVHGALQPGRLATTFTASQGLLLMIPNMYKIAGELTSFCMHVAARTVATHALSIFGDHSDVMACRQTGFALLCSNSVQEAQDLGCHRPGGDTASRGFRYCTSSTGFAPRTRWPRSRFCRTTDMALIDEEAIAAHRRRALTPDHPVIRGTAQNPDVFFQAREACNPYYLRLPGIVQEVMDEFGPADRPRVSAVRLFRRSGGGARARADGLRRRDGSRDGGLSQSKQGEKVGVLGAAVSPVFRAGLCRRACPRRRRWPCSIAPRSRARWRAALSGRVAALRERLSMQGSRRSTEPRSSAGGTACRPRSSRRRWSRPSSMNWQRRPKNHFTIGINDDVTTRRCRTIRNWDIEPDDVVRASSSVSGRTGRWAPTRTRSRSSARRRTTTPRATSSTTPRSPVRDRFAPAFRAAADSLELPDRSATSSPATSSRFWKNGDARAMAKPGGVFLLNAPYPPEEVWDNLPREVQQQIIDKRAASSMPSTRCGGSRNGMGGRINTIMQTCFFAVSGVLPRDEAIAQIKKAIEKTYGKKGEEMVRRNFAAIDAHAGAICTR